MGTLILNNTIKQSRLLRVALFLLLAVSVFSSTSFAVEVSGSPAKSCAGQAEPNFFHLDDSGFENVEFRFQDSEYGPSLKFGDNEIFFSAKGAQDQSQQGAGKKGGSWMIMSKNPGQFGESGQGIKPNQAFGPFRKRKDGDTSSGPVTDYKQFSLSVKGQQLRLQVREKKDANGKILETEMYILGSGGTKLKITPETQKNGNSVTSKMKVEAINTGTNKIVGRTEASVKGSMKEGGEGNEFYKFASCQNLNKQGKQAKSKYQVPKFTKDLNGDHHIIGAQQGPNNQFIAEDADAGHAAFRQRTDGAPDRPLRRTAMR